MISRGQEGRSSLNPERFVDVGDTLIDTLPVPAVPRHPCRQLQEVNRLPLLLGQFHYFRRRTTNSETSHQRDALIKDPINQQQEKLNDMHCSEEMRRVLHVPQQVKVINAAAEILQLQTFQGNQIKH